MAVSRNGVIQVEWDGLDEFVSKIDKLEKKLMDEIEEEMKIYSLLVETGAKALAFRFSGDLEESIVSEPIKRSGNIVIGAVGSNLVYAWIRHEAPYSSGTRDMYDNGAKFSKYYLNGRGQRTRAKSTWRGEIPGRKYLERAVVRTENDFEQAMTRAMERALEGLL